MSQKVLIVEDDQFLSDIYKQKLVSAGFEIHVATDGEEGLRAFDSFKPDLIVLDLIMPKMNGFDFLEALRKKESGKRTSVIVLSNLGQESDKAQCAKFQVKTYLVKTEIGVDEIVTQVRKELGSK